MPIIPPEIPIFRLLLTNSNPSKWADRWRKTMKDKRYTKQTEYKIRSVLLLFDIDLESLNVKLSRTGIKIKA